MHSCLAAPAPSWQSTPSARACGKPNHVTAHSCVWVLQVTTQLGITAGLEADQAVKLAHITSLHKEAAALRGAIEEQAQRTQGAEQSLAATQAELTHRDTAMAGACMPHRLVPLYVCLLYSSFRL